MFDVPDERRLASELEAAIDGKTVLVDALTVVAVLTGRFGNDDGELEPAAIVRIEGRPNHSEGNVDFGILLRPEDIVFAIEYLTIALHKLARFPEGGGFVVG